VRLELNITDYEKLKWKKKTKRSETKRKPSSIEKPINSPVNREINLEGINGMGGMIYGKKCCEAGMKE